MTSTRSTPVAGPGPPVSSTTAVTGIRASPDRTSAVCAPSWNDDTTGLPLSLLAQSVSGTEVAAEAPGALRTVDAIGEADERREQGDEALPGRDHGPRTLTTAVRFALLVS